MSTILTLIITLIISVQITKATDSTTCSGIAKEFILSKIKEENKSYKNLEVKAYHKLSKTNSIVGIRALIVEQKEKMHYNFIVNVNHENPKKPYGQTFFSVSDKQREEMFKKK